MNGPEQDAFRRELRARTRPAQYVDDEEWRPRPSWGWTTGVPRGKPGPPPTKNPTPGVLAARRYRERKRAERLAQQEATRP
jgi:hypothetical protein